MNITKYPEVSAIKEDITSLKGNVVDLSHSVAADGRQEYTELKRVAAEKVSDLIDKGKVNFQTLETRVREKPGQSVLMAFGAGALLSMFLRRG